MKKSEHEIWKCEKSFSDIQFENLLSRFCSVHSCKSSHAQIFSLQLNSPARDDFASQIADSSSPSRGPCPHPPHLYLLVVGAESLQQVILLLIVLVHFLLRRRRHRVVRRAGETRAGRDVRVRRHMSGRQLADAASDTFAMEESE